jgi:hypothetical protein
MYFNVRKHEPQKKRLSKSNKYNHKYCSQLQSGRCDTLVAVIIVARRSSVAALGAVLGTLGLGGLAQEQSVRVPADLVTAAVVAGVHGAAGAAHTLVVLARRHDGASEGAIGMQGGLGTRSTAVVQVVGIQTEAVVATVVAYINKIN